MNKKWLPLILLFAAAGLLIFFHSLTVTDADKLYLSVETNNANGWEITALRDGEEIFVSPDEAVCGDDTIFLRRVVGEDWGSYDRVRVSNFRQMCVFVNDALVFSNCDTPATTGEELSRESRPAEAVFYEVFSVNPAWQGKTITIVTRNYTTEVYSSVGFDLISDWAQAMQVSARTSKKALPGAMFGTLTLLLFGLFLYRAFLGGDGALSLLLLALAALLQMIYCLDGLGEFSQLSMFLPEEQALFLLLPLLYLATWMRKERKAFLGIVLSVWAVYFAFVFSWRLGLNLPIWVDRLNYLTAVLAVVALFFTLKCARKGNPRFKRFVWLALLFFICSLGVFGLSALIYRPLFDGICICLREAIAGYPSPLVFGIFSGVLIILFLMAIEDLVEYRVHTARELENLRMRGELTAQSLSGIERTNETLAMARHDELHHLRTLSALCVEQPEKAVAYAASLTKDIEEIPTMRFTQNRLVNAILSIQASSADKRGVTFEAKAQLPENLSLPEQDISTVLMNLIDNAVQAAAKAPAARTVKVNLTLEDGTLLITVANSLPADFDRERFRNSFKNIGKSDITRRGYGIRSARRVVARYGNELCYAVQNGDLVVNTAMELPAAKRTNLPREDS